MNRYIKYINLIKKINLFSNNKLSVKKQTFFIKNLSFLIKSGSSLVESMDLIKRQTKFKSEKIIFEKIIFDLKDGRSLATSFKRCDGIFSNFIINIIRAGELSGNLSNDLDHLADELKKKNLLHNKIMGALLYPFVITIATLGITGFLIIYIFPKILPIFQSLGARLPVSTKIIIILSNILRLYGIYIFLIIIVLIIVINLIIKNNNKIKLIYDQILLRLPLIGNLIKNYNISNIFRTIGLLLNSNMPLSQTLLITSETINNLYYKKSFQEISLGVNTGKNISSLMHLYPLLFPEILCHMIEIGEKSGNLPETFIYLSEFYENGFDDQTKNLSNSIEPALMIIMGIIIGFVAISFITPIYEITNSLKK